MKSNQKGFSVLLAVLILMAAALVGAGVYLYVTQIAKPKSVLQSSVNDQRALGQKTSPETVQKQQAAPESAGQFEIEVLGQKKSGEEQQKTQGQPQPTGETTQTESATISARTNGIISVSNKPAENIQPAASAGAWQDCDFEKIASLAQSSGERRLVCKNGGSNQTIKERMDDFMKWDAGQFSPKKVAFDSRSQTLFFVKYMNETGHSAGFFALDLVSLGYRESPKVGKIYESYSNFISIVSTDGSKIASLGFEELYLLDPAADKVELLVDAPNMEIFFAAQSVPDFKWLDSQTIQYPAYKSGALDKPYKIKQVTIK